MSLDAPTFRSPAGESEVPQNSFDPGADWGPSGCDIRKGLGLAAGVAVFVGEVEDGRFGFHRVGRLTRVAVG